VLHVEEAKRSVRLVAVTPHNMRIAMEEINRYDTATKDCPPLLTQKLLLVFSVRRSQTLTNQVITREHRRYAGNSRSIRDRTRFSRGHFTVGMFGTRPRAKELGSSTTGPKDNGERYEPRRRRVSV